VVQLSVVMITKNAERLLDLVLEKAAQVADEIIIVDALSTDRTVEIASKYTSKVITQPWLGFGLQKQKALDLATGEWVLALDADEVLTEELIVSINQLKQTGFEGPYSGYKIKRPLVFAGRILRRTVSLWILRLFKRSEGQFTSQAVHERLLIEGRVGRIESGELLHYSYENVSDWLTRMNRYTDLSVEEKKSSRKSSVTFAVLSGMGIFFKLYVLKRGFLDGKMGFVFALNWGFSNYLKYLKLALIEDFEVKQ
jgi:glycosyltransferase involved in cell wall biosynthesis